MHRPFRTPTDDTAERRQRPPWEPRLDADPPEGDGPEQEEDHPHAGEDCRPGRVTERWGRRLRPWRSARPGNRDLARLAHRAGRGPRLRRAGPPGRPAAGGSRRRRPDRCSARRPVAIAPRARARVRSIVIRSGRRVRQERPRLVDAPHALGRVLATILVGLEIRVMPFREPPMGTSHLQRGRVARHAEGRVRIGEWAMWHRPPWYGERASSDEHPAP
jgi:hypothetical protein